MRSLSIAGARGDRWLTICAAATLLATIVFGVQYWRAQQRALTQARERAHGEAQRAARVIEADLSRMPGIVRAIADDFSSGRTPKARLVERLKQAIDTAPQLIGLGAAFSAYQYDPGLRLYAPYYRRVGENTELIDLDARYDYTQGDRDWFRRPFTDGPSWSEPALTDASSVPVVEFSVPFTDGPSSTTPIGVIHGTISLSAVDELIRSLDLGEFGYGFLVSNKNFVISHPFGTEQADRIGIDAGPARRDAVRGMFNTLHTGKAAVIEHVVDPVTGEPSWVFSEPVPATGWTVGVVFFKEETAGGRLFRRPQMRATLAALAFATTLLLMAFVRRYDGSLPMLWQGVLATTVLFVIGIGCLWREGYASTLPRTQEQTIFANTTSVRQFRLVTTKTSLTTRGTLPYFVPTGVYIQTLDVASPTNVLVTGYVWQRYAKNIPASIARAFTLPDAADSTIKESFRRSEGDADTIGWTIKATIRQSFDFAKYPLDQQTFQLRVWHADIEKGVILLPDLDAYRIFHPLARPGIEKNLILPGWNVERTQFTNDMTARSTSFGAAGSNSDTANELSFNIVLNRKILEPVFSSLLPLTVASFMVFSLLLLVRESTRGNVVQILSAFSGLFFVGILSELDLRRRLASSSISYIEYFYFVLYGAIVCVALVNLTNAYPGYFPRIEHREHLWPKLLYWPAILTALLVLTVLVFY